MKVSCKVWFNDGSVKTFYGFWSKIILDIANYCNETGLETINAKWF